MSPGATKISTDPWWKSELAIAVGIISALFALVLWFAQAEMMENKTQNKAQWAQAAKTKDCLLQEISELKAQVARIQGYHDAEKDYGCKVKEGAK